MFAGLGATVIDADALARDAVAPGTPGLAEIRRRWPGAIGAGGTLDRKALAAIVFNDERERDALNAIVHPAVRAAAAVREAAVEPDRIVIHEVPLLFESGRMPAFQATVLVVAPVEERIARVGRRSAMPRAEVERRMAAQIAPDEARRLATFTIENDGDLAALQARIERVYESLRHFPRSSG
jgi:dephospho-CoA kinase